jgi:hypothetical protein
MGRWHRRRDVHTARARPSSRGTGSAAACSPRALPWCARWPLRLAAGGRAGPARVGTGATATSVGLGDTPSGCPLRPMGGAPAACVRGGRLALSALRRSDDPARRSDDPARSSVAASHPAHPRHLGRPSTARRRIRLSRSTPLWVRCRASRGGPVPCSERHRAPQRYPRWAESASATCSLLSLRKPTAVRSEGRWNHLSVPRMRPPLLHSLEAPDGQPSVVPVRVSAFDGPEPVRVAPSLSSGFTRLVSLFCALSRPKTSHRHRMMDRPGTTRAEAIGALK